MATFKVVTATGKVVKVEAESLDLMQGNYVFRAKADGMGSGPILAMLPQDHVRYAARDDAISDTK